MSSAKSASGEASAEANSTTEDSGFSFIRIMLVLLFGGIVVAIFGAMARDRIRIVPIRRRRGPVMTVEEAIRMRPH